MQIIGPRLRDDIYYRAGISAVLGVKSIGQYAKFLNTVGARLHGRKVDEQIVGVSAIHAEVVRSPAAPVYRNGARAITPVNNRIARSDSRHDSRLQLQKLIGVASVQWQLGHCPLADDGAELCTGGVHQWRFGCDLNCFLRTSWLQNGVESEHLVQFQNHIGSHIFLEALQCVLRGQLARRRPDVLDVGVEPGDVGLEDVLALCRQRLEHAVVVGVAVGERAGLDVGGHA